MQKPTKCPITISEFAQANRPMKVTIDGRDIVVETKQFSTGSFGWHLNDKITVEVGGKRVLVQVGLNMTVVGSKPGA